eukprot:gb/GEZJ01009373.1/.p2 GENE.gb/GEZJ01009373.1/~~gb/GEZJ01009373.1/.p2  ORF type:complete len:101 (+),score=2.61 gb/GEZJ01009373.1/:460-762(+)
MRFRDISRCSFVVFRLFQFSFFVPEECVNMYMYMYVSVTVRADRNVVRAWWLCALYLSNTAFSSMLRLRLFYPYSYFMYFEAIFAQDRRENESFMLCTAS